MDDEASVSSDPGAEEPVILRTEDGAWYAVPAGDLDRARITDPDRLAQPRGHLTADRSGAPALTFSAEALAAYRLDDARAAELEAAIAADTAGFGEPRTSRSVYGYFAYDYNTVHIVHSTVTEGQPGARLVSIYRVPLNLVAQRGLLVRGPGHGR
jgi:hypothetical protein